MGLTSTQLALLVEISRTGSLARTAASLEVSPPAISQQLARLERELGLVLVERGARGASLTPVGQALAAHGERVEDELQAADQAASELKGRGRTMLRIGSIDSVSNRLLPDVLAAIMHQFPAAKVSLINQDPDPTIEMVAAGELDVGLVCFFNSPPRIDGVVYTKLMDEPMLVVLSDDHRLAHGTDPIDLADLAEETWTCHPLPNPARQQLDDAAAREGFLPQVTFETLAYDVMQSLAGAAVAVAIVAEMGLVPLPTTVARPLKQDLRRSLYAVSPSKGQHLRFTVPFLSALQQVTDEYVATNDATREVPRGKASGK